MGTPETVIDLDAYLRRVGYDGPRTPTPETLVALHLQHPMAIAFENLDPLLHRPVKLDSESLQEKLVVNGRGGYCFEQNLLFMHALRALGFRVSGLAARILWNQPEDAIMPRGHMLLRVEIGGETYLADVGFGALTQTAPLCLKAGLEQATPHESFRLERDDDVWRMRAHVGGDWCSLYRFQLEEQFQVDYEVTNYYLSTSPASHFRHTLIAARPTSDGRYALFNNRFTIYDRDGRAKRRELETAGAIENVLRMDFGIAAPDSDSLTAAFSRESIL